MDNKILAGIIAAIIIVGAAAFSFTLNPESPEKPQPIKVEENVFVEEKLTNTLEKKDGLIKFTSYDEIKEFLKDNQNQQYDFYPIRRDGGSIPTMTIPGGPLPSAPDMEVSEESQNAGSDTYPDFSGTNIQVKNVDEPDYIKTDGKYLYLSLIHI